MAMRMIVFFALMLLGVTAGAQMLECEKRDSLVKEYAYLNEKLWDYIEESSCKEEFIKEATYNDYEYYWETMRHQYLTCTDFTGKTVWMDVRFTPIRKRMKSVTITFSELMDMQMSKLYRMIWEFWSEKSGCGCEYDETMVWNFWVDHKKIILDGGSDFISVKVEF